MDEKFAKLLELAASANRQIEYTIEKVVVRTSGGDGDEIVAEAAIVPIISPVDVAGGGDPSTNVSMLSNPAAS